MRVAVAMSGLPCVVFYEAHTNNKATRPND
jgi:hypothetical protein